MCDQKRTLIFSEKEITNASKMDEDALCCIYKQKSARVPVGCQSACEGPIRGFIYLIPSSGKVRGKEVVTKGGRLCIWV